MGLKKGMTNNKHGRPAGIPNKSTAEIKEILLQFLSKNIGNIQQNYDKLESEKQLIFIEKLLKYYLPTHINTSVDMSEKQVVVFRHEDSAPPEWWLINNPEGTQNDWLREVANGKQMMPPIINITSSTTYQ